MGAIDEAKGFRSSPLARLVDDLLAAEVAHEAARTGASQNELERARRAVIEACHQVGVPRLHAPSKRIEEGAR